MASFIARIAGWLRNVGSRSSNLTDRGRRDLRKFRRSASSHHPASVGSHQFGGHHFGGLEYLERRELMAVTYHGGSLLTSVEAQPVFLGSDWSSDTTLANQSAALNQFVGFVVDSSYMDMLNQAGYGVGRGSSTGGQTLKVALNKSTGISDTQVQSALQTAINSGQIAAPTANRLYVVYVEPGVAVRMGTDSSTANFLGYHGAFAGKTATGRSVDIRYAVMPYPGSPNPSPRSQGYASVLDELTAVTSHELAEAVTDPDANYKTIGWYDDRMNGEIGDLTSQTTRLGSFLVQDVVDKTDRVLAPVDNSSVGGSDTSGSGGPGGVSGPRGSGGGVGGGGVGGGGVGGGSVGGGSVGGTATTLAAPTNLAVAALSTTSASLSWTPSSGAAGYRVYLEESGRTRMIGAVAANRVSVTVTGLTAGALEGFYVEAFADSTTADSDTVVITMPSEPTLLGPDVSATVLSPTSAQLSWNAVAGAAGYRVYLWNGFRAVYLATVAANSTSVTVRGLTPGSTSQLMVSAFRGNTTAESDWVSVSTPWRSRSVWPF